MSLDKIEGKTKKTERRRTGSKEPQIKVGGVCIRVVGVVAVVITGAVGEAREEITVEGIMTEEEEQITGEGNDQQIEKK